MRRACINGEGKRKDKTTQQNPCFLPVEQLIDFWNVSPISEPQKNMLCHSRKMTTRQRLEFALYFQRQGKYASKSTFVTTALY